MAWFCLRKNDKTSTLLPTIYIHTCILVLIPQRVKKKRTMREFQGKVGRSWVNNWVTPNSSTIQLSLSQSMIVLSKSKTITTLAIATTTDRFIILWERKDTKSFCYNLAKHLHHRGGWYMNILQVVDKYILLKCPT